MNNQQEFEKHVNTIYSRRSARYRILHGLQTLGIDDHWRKIIATKIVHGGYAQLIEPGTGTGLTAATLMRMGFRGKIVGVDINEQMLAQTENVLLGNDRYTKMVANVMSLPFPDDFFDAGYSVVGLGGVYDVKRAFMELMRVIKHEGMFFAIEMCAPRTKIRKWLHHKITAKTIWRNWAFRDIEVEPILLELGLNEYIIDYRKDLGFGSVFELAVKIIKNQ